MNKRARTYSTFLISLFAHGLLLSLPLTLIPAESPQEEISVQVEIEKIQLLPKIEQLAEKRKLKEVKALIKESISEQEIKSQHAKAEIEEIITNDSSPVTVNKENEDIVEKEATAQEELRKFVDEEKIEVINSDEEAMLRYQDMVKRKIQELRKYPLWAKKQGFEGVSSLRFTLSSDGVVRDIKIFSSSGFKILDREAVSTIKKASPFLRVPSKIKNSILTMEITLVFQLE